MKYNCLFQPVRIGKLTIKNRFVQSPMESQTTLPDHTFSEQSIGYFAARAKGGFGLQFTDYMAISPDGIGVKEETGWWDDAFIESHRRLADAVHENNGTIFAQLHHSGMMTERKNTGTTAKGPSAFPAANHMEVVEAFTTQECYKIAELYGDAARRAKAAGFDGVEVHGAHGYLLGQFLSRYSNKRVDEFGGNYEGRFRLSELCIRNIKKKCGIDFPVTYRISTDEYVDGGMQIKDAIIFARMAEEAGVDAINVSVGTGIGGNIVTPSYSDPGWNVLSAAKIRENVSIPTIVVGRLNDPQLMKYIIETGKADLVALGRQSVADPDFPNKVYEGRTEEIIPCLGCMQRCYYGTGCEEDDTGISCVLNPFSGKETRWQIREADVKKHVLVAGAGPAGLEAAWVLAKRGHQVDLYEQKDLPGGNFRLAAMPPFKEDLAQAISSYMALCRRYGVRIHMGRQVTEELIREEAPDAIVLATGSNPLAPPIPGLQDTGILYAEEILDGRTPVGNKKVLIMGGGLVGCELADYMNQFGNSITIVEMQAALAKDDVKRSRVVLMDRLERKGTRAELNARIREIRKDGVLIERDGQEEELTGYDVVVLALGYRNNNPLGEIARKYTDEVYVIGDASRARNAKFAVYEGAKTAMKI